MSGGKPGRQEMESDLAAFGLPVEVAASAADEDCDCWVLEENWEAVQVFLRCATQWRYAGMEGKITGLDYAAVESVMRMRGVHDTADTLDRLRVMEGVALRALKERN